MLYKREEYRRGHLTARAKSVIIKGAVERSLQTLSMGSNKKSYYYAPKKYDPRVAIPLAVLLHGAGGNAKQGLSLLRDYADEQNILLLAPSSQDYTWDIIAGDSFDQDVIFLDELLTVLFERYTIDPAHLAIGWFSDGPSYALSLGLNNADLFIHIIAFSPGFYYTVEEKGRPVIFISHGTSDPVLSINACSRRIVPQLQCKGFTVQYEEFDDGHVIPPVVSQAAVEWFLTGG